MNKLEPVGLSTAPSMARALAIVARSSQAVGAAYFPELVQGLAHALGARWALVGSIDPAEPTQVETLAFWNDGPAENFTYWLKDTPCAEVAVNAVCCFPNDVQREFPLDRMLIDMGVQSYAGAPLRAADGRVLGLLAVLGERPFADPELVKEIVSLFSGRAAAELERLAAATLNERLGRIVEGSVSEAYVFDGQTCRFELVNRGARENLGYTMDELTGMTPWDIKPELTRDSFLEMVQPLLTGAQPVLEFETVHQRKDGSVYPVAVKLQYFPDAGGVFFASITDETERKAREEREKVILHEMNHRAKNLLSVVQVLARQTARHSPEDFADRFEARIQALAASHDVLVHNTWREIPVDELVRSQLGHFRTLIGNRIRLSGSSTRLGANAAQAFGLALHELSTNASKYGALSGEQGTIAIGWSVTAQDSGEPAFTLTWQESGGPTVAAPSSRGFGSTLIERSLASQFGCKVDLRFEPSGVVCVFQAPAARVVTDTSKVKHESAH